jgi:hypothetical protein
MIMMYNMHIYGKHVFQFLLNYFYFYCTLYTACRYKEIVIHDVHVHTHVYIICICSGLSIKSL